MWLKLKEFKIIFDLLIWIYMLEEYRAHFELFSKRVAKYFEFQLLRRQNNRFVYTYLKECYTLTVSVLYSRSQYVPKVRISVDSSGLPRIIPVPLRRLIRSNKNVLLGVLSVLGLHRIIKYEPKVDTGTITKPFIGVGKTVSVIKLNSAINNLLQLAGLSKSNSSNFRLKLSGIRGLIVEKAGPNGPAAFRRIFIDAIALMNDFNLLLTLSKWYCKYGGKRYLLSLYLILLLNIPIYLLLKLLKVTTTSHLGRLGVVYNVTGKARVVAMTNWWIQIGLYPLHKSIFDLLGRLPTDGTFDQVSPIKRLTGLKLDDSFYSLDLSAATDRLPIDLQEQILTVLIGADSASMWRTLLSVPYATSVRGDSPSIRYAVGQPMGAYSSWAMLALTHHLIVLMSSHTSKPFSSYAVLGDDVVIQDSSVAREYLSLMNYLGVEISLPKSMISYNHLEFAKKIFTKQGEIVSIISPGLLLATARNGYLLGMLMSEAFVRKLFDLSSILKVIQSSPLKADQLGFGLWSMFGLRGLITNNQVAAQL
jgi:hypothetical protein